MTEKNTDTRKRARKFALDTIDFCKKLPNQRIYWTIVDQVIRSSMSIGANLIEAVAASSRKDFINYYHIALKSANETAYWLGILKDSSLTVHSIDELNSLIREVDEISSMIAKSLITLKKKNS